MSSFNNRLNNKYKNGRRNNRPPEQGVTAEAHKDRRNLLDHNLEKVKLEMLDCLLKGNRDPVGFIADLRNWHGRQLALAFGQTDDQIDAHIDEMDAADKIPTVVCVDTMEFAEQILPNTSPTAAESLANWKRLRLPGHYLVLVIASGGNTYAQVGLPVARDGMHRVNNGTRW